MLHEEYDPEPVDEVAAMTSDPVELLYEFTVPLTWPPDAAAVMY
jgi:hypothetical protein